MALPMLFCNIELKIYVPDGFEGMLNNVLLLKLLILLHSFRFHGRFI